MSEENELDVCSKGVTDLPDYEDEASKSSKNDTNPEPIVRIKQETVSHSDEEEFDSELEEEEEEINSASEDSEFDDEAESEEELQEEDENGKLSFVLSSFLVVN